MPDAQSNKGPGGLVLNLRVLDQDSVDDLVGRLQEAVDKAEASSSALRDLVQHAAEAPEIAAHLEERLRVGMRMVKALGSLNESGTALARELGEKQEAADAATTQAAALAAEFRAQITELEGQLASRLEQLSREALESMQQRFGGTLQRAEQLVRVIEEAESHIALSSLRAAMNGSRTSAPTTPARSVRAAHQGHPQSEPSSDEAAPPGLDATEPARSPAAADHQFKQELREQMTMLVRRCEALELEQAAAKPDRSAPDQASAATQPAGEPDHQHMDELRQRVNSLTERCEALEHERAAARTKRRARRQQDAPIQQPANGPTSQHVDELREQVSSLTERCEALEHERLAAYSAVDAQRSLLLGMHEELIMGLDELVNAAESLRRSDLQGQQKQHAERVSDSTAALRDMVSGMPELARAQSVMAGPAPALPAPNWVDFDLRTTIESITGHLSKRAKDRGVTLTCEVDSDVPALVRGDCPRLRQVLLYVINTAIKLAAKGEITLRAIVEAANDSNTIVKVTATHEGSSIPQRQLEQLFTPASATDGAPAAVPGGPRAGTGLMIARQLVERMGGKLNVASEDGVRFTIWFTSTWDKRTSQGDSRRAANRLRLESVESNFGPVLDLSLGGARITSSKKLDGQVEVQLSDSDHTVTLLAEVIWCNKLGWRKHEVGLRFVHVPSDAAERLTRISIQNRVRRVMENE